MAVNDSPGVAQSRARCVILERFAGLELRLDTPKGRGVFATTPIPTGTILDISPVLVLSISENTQHISQSSLYHYTYNWPIRDADGKVKIGQAVVFGLGSMFNHANRQNVSWERDVHREVIMYKTLRDIGVGEELCISYGDRLWFANADVDADASMNGRQENGEDMLDNIQIDI